MGPVVLPGQTLGVLGGGQLGRMLAIAARRMGYRVICLDPTPDCPAGQVADVELVAPYTDLDAARRLAEASAAVTVEFENIPAATLEFVAGLRPTRPSARVLHIAQHRLREKCWLQDNGFATVQFAALSSHDIGSVRAAGEAVGFPAILKSASFGYDGKGQCSVGTLEQLQTLAAELAMLGEGQPTGATHVLERRAELVCELSVIVARSADGRMVCYPVFENTHVGGILDCTRCPADIEPTLAAAAVAVAEAIAEQIGMVGVLCVELFVDTGGRLLVNELAPRPHNSGHLTVDAAICCQFEQQLRCTAGLSLGPGDLAWPAAAMVQLLGDLWSAGEPDWGAALACGPVKLHLYGKSGAREGRKMGHITAWGATVGEAEALARRARAAAAGGRSAERG